MSKEEIDKDILEIKIYFLYLLLYLVSKIINTWKI